MLQTQTLEPALLNEDHNGYEFVHKLPPSPPADEFRTPYIIDDVLKILVRDAPDEPLVGYLKSAQGVIDYVYYTPSDLDRFANGAVKEYKRAGLPEVTMNPLSLMKIQLAKTDPSSPIRTRTALSLFSGPQTSIILCHSSHCLGWGILCCYFQLALAPRHTQIYSP